MSFNLRKMIGCAVHCDTREKARSLMLYLDKQGIRFEDGKQASSFNHFGRFGTDTCFYINYNEVLYDNNIYAYINHGTKVYEFEEVLI